MADNTVDAKIRQAEELLIRARALTGCARNLLREAGVPYIATMTECADLLMSDAVKLAKVVAFDDFSDDDDEEVTDERPTRPVERVA